MVKSTFLQFIKYNLVGIVNTIVGFSIIFLLMYLGLEPILSNAVGYALGAILSYYLNKKYTFNSTADGKVQAIRFFMVMAISYLLNFVVLQWLLGFTNPYYAQILSAVVYTLSSFLLAKFLVFKDISI